MNRADLYFQLWATLPHVSTNAIPWPYLGITSGGGECWTYASDTYTICATRRPSDADIPESRLVKKEAQELARFVRPKNKAQELEPVELAVSGYELHVGLPDDSAVFEVVSEFDANFDLSELLDKIETLEAMPVDTKPIVINPELAGKFALAKRDEADRLTYWPRRCRPEAQVGVGVMVVGDSCIGAVCGMTEVPASDVLRSILFGEGAAA